MSLKHPIQLSSYEQMLELLNGGVSIWMIYGHSSPNAVDFDIGARKRQQLRRYY
jgi:hypothetical protein